MTILGKPIEAPDDAVAVLTFADGEALVREGDAADAVHVVLSGDVVVHTSSGVTLDTLGAGALVGELSVVAGGTRTATVSASGEVSTLRIERDAFIDLLADDADVATAVAEEASRRLDERRFAEFARRMLGAGVTVPFQEFRSRLTWSWVLAGETLYRRGDPGDAGYLVVSGRLAVIDEDTQTVISEIGQDQFIGESGVLEGRARQVTVVAIRDSMVAKVSRHDAVDLLGRYPQMLGPLMLDIGRRARRGVSSSSRHTVALAVHADTDRRVFAARVLDELERHGRAAHLWKGRVDSLLDTPGAADSEAPQPVHARLSQLIHEFEVEHDSVLFEVDQIWSRWSERATRQADRLVAVVEPNPDEATCRELDRFFGTGADTAQRILVVLHPQTTDRPAGTAEWSGRFRPDRILHMRAGASRDMQRLGRFLAGRPYGLVLGGGGARGFAHIGVRRAMDELGIPIDTIGGTSIGSPMGIGIAMDMPQEEYQRTVEQLFSGILDYTLPIVSLVKGERITRSIEEGLRGWTFEDLWKPFFCVSTNLTQSTEQIHRHGDVIPAVRASVSIPGVLPPVSWGDDLLVDGGVLNNLPADIMRRDVEDGTVIAVDVAPPTGPKAKRDIALSVSGWQALRAMSGRGKPSYPGITALMMRTMIAGSIRERSRVLERGDIDLYLDLDLRGISLLDFEKVAPVAQAGYEAAMPRLEAWLAEER